MGTGIVFGIIIGTVLIIAIHLIRAILLNKNERKTLSEHPLSVTVRCSVSSRPTDHIGAHRRLNGVLRELVTDWMSATGAKIATSTVVELLVWSKTQAMKPDHDWPGNGDLEYCIDREITKYLEAEASKAEALKILDAAIEKLDSKAASEEKNEEGPNAVHQ